MEISPESQVAGNVNETTHGQQSSGADRVPSAVVTDFFLELTPDRVLMAIEDAGFAPTGHCTPLTCLENRVYDLRLEDDRHIVAKFYRPGR